MKRPDFMLKGQPYWRAGKMPHTTRDGREITLDVWRTFCADCGEPIHVTSKEDADPGNRRCALHKSPGRQVGARRKRSA